MSGWPQAFVTFLMFGPVCISKAWYVFVPSFPVGCHMSLLFWYDTGVFRPVGYQQPELK